MSIRNERGESMRRRIRPLRSILTAGALTAGLLVGASATASAVPMESTPATAQVSAQAVNNLGLTIRQAKGVQQQLRTVGQHNIAVDGYLGPQSWKALQIELQDPWGYNGDIDGIVGPKTIKALQRALGGRWGYPQDEIDGIAGPKTRAAFARWANWCADKYGY